MSSTYLYIIYRKQNSFFIIYGKEFFCQLLILAITAKKAFNLVTFRFFSTESYLAFVSISVVSFATNSSNGRTVVSF